MFSFSRTLLLAAVCAGTSFSLQAERIVTLGASVTETVFALGAGDAVVARDASSLFPAAAAKLPDVGYFRTIGAEGVLAQNPTLILADYGTGPEQQVTVLKNSGVRFVHLEARPSSASVLAMIAKVGEAVGKSDEARALSARLVAQFDEAATLAKNAGNKPKVIFLMGVTGSTLQAAYDNTAAGGLIALAGGVNPLSGLTGYKALTPEAILQLDPDFILYADKVQGGAVALSLTDTPAWLKASRALRENHVLPVSMTYHLVFGPRIGEAVLDVARRLHAPAATVDVLKN